MKENTLCARVFGANSPGIGAGHLTGGSALVATLIDTFKNLDPEQVRTVGRRSLPAT